MLRGIKVNKSKPEPDLAPLKKVKNNEVIRQADEDELLQQKLHHQRIKEKGLRLDEIEDDDIEQGNQQKSKQEIRQHENRRNQAKGEQMYQQRKNNRLLASCKYCLSNQLLSENQILSNGNHSMLIFPEQRIFSKYWHFYILPIEHVSCLKELEDEIYEEIRNYMKCLIQAFDSKMEVIFFENAYDFANYPHAVLECVVIPSNFLQDVKANVYFKQGMDDLDGFWSTHKKIIELTKSKGGLRKQIPKGFPYFYVDFGMEFGYGHVIENEKYFSINFAREIIGNILKLQKGSIINGISIFQEPIKEGSRPPESSVRTPEEARADKATFQQLWKKYDWTVVLQQETS